MPHDASIPAVTTRPVPAAAPGSAGLLRGVQAGVAAYLVWGLLTIYWKALGDLDPVEMIAWRVIASAAVMAIVLTARRSWRPVIAAMREPRQVAQTALASALLIVNWLCYVFAVVNDHVLETALGYFMAPLGTMAIGVFVLGERRTRLQQAAMISAAAAIGVLTVSYGKVPLTAIAIAASWSLYGLVKRRSALPAVDGFAAESFVLVPLAIIALAVLSGRADSIPNSASGTQWVLVLLTGVVTAGPLILFAVAASNVPFTLLGPIQYMVPTINLFLGWAVYQEDMPAARLAGFALVWLALIMVTLDQLRRHRAPR